MGLPCQGLKVSLFQTGEDMCGWCPQTCLPYIAEGAKCWTTITSSQAYVRQINPSLPPLFDCISGNLRARSDLLGA